MATQTAEDSPQPIAVKGIVFDLDGTLIDSAPDIAQALNSYVSAKGQAPLNVETVGQFIGRGPRPLVEDVLAAAGLPTEPSHVDEAMNHYLETYAANPTDRTTLFPGVREDILYFAEAGYRLGICTNKPHALTLSILDNLNIASCFGAVAGPDVVARSKPDPEHLLTVVNDLGLTAPDIAYVGDSGVDKATADRAGIPFFVVPWGTGAGVDVPDSQRLSRLRDLERSLTLKA